jgi:anthranilate synthase component II
MILVIDNYDSFVHNLARYFRRLGHDTKIVRNDSIDAAAVRQLAPNAIVISPGPCTPNEAGCSVELVRELCGEIPILGVCLGHQAIAAAFGARIVPAREPMHGRTSQITHNEAGIFERIPSPLSVCRYHSLVVNEATLPAAFSVTARTDDGTIMAIEHAEFPVIGVQFHPEATLTKYGYQMLANFLRLAGLSADSSVEKLAASEFRFPAPNLMPLPSGPVTF